jgi:hypothetical protein
MLSKIKYFTLLNRTELKILSNEYEKKTLLNYEIAKDIDLSGKKIKEINEILDGRVIS